MPATDPTAPIPVHPDNAEALRLVLLGQREWITGPMSGHLERWDMVACESVWRMRGYPVGSDRLAPHVARAVSIADAYLAEANRLIVRRRVAEDRRRGRRGRHGGADGR